MPSGRGPPSAVVASAAFQDYFSRTLKLGAVQPALVAGLSLAQRLNLVPGPVRLSPAAWQDVHVTAIKRAEGYREDCAICLQPLADHPQVLLSCSHVYHEACQRSFERWAGQQTCPLCRCQTYTRRSVAALDRALRQAPAPSASQPVLRRRWCAEQLAARSDRLVDEVEESSCEIDALFAELDDSLAAAGAQTQQLAGVAGLGVAGARQESLGATNSVAPAEPGPAAAGPRGCSGKDPGGTVDWEGILQRCLLRDEQLECPICLAALQPSSSGGGGGDHAGGIAVLSCSHACHAHCLDAFEAYALASELPQACPCCRALYARMDLS